MISLESRVYAPSPHAREMPEVAPGLYAFLGKRLFDLFVTGLLTLFVFVWLVPVIALAIALTSRGPVFFGQLRTGRNGRPFRYWKFRTSTCQLGVDPTSRAVTVTPVGRFLRATQLEKLPQFINVLVGDLSLVGPQPHPLPYDAQHWLKADYRNRYRVRPGLVSLAQTRAQWHSRPERVQMQEEIRYDRWYRQRASFWLDLKICKWAITGAGAK